MAHGITNLMRNIRTTTGGPKFLHEHTTPTRAMRRRGIFIEGDKTGAQARALLRSPLPVPYVNPARDLKPGRRLRRG